MPETHEHDPERVERQLRNVRLKLVSARREVQTLHRQAGVRNAEKQMRLQIDRAERRVSELEQSEEKLAQLLGTAPATEAEAPDSQPATTDGPATTSDLS
jgi:TolA-binding protein